MTTWAGSIFRIQQVVSVSFRPRSFIGYTWTIDGYFNFASDRNFSPSTRRSGSAKTGLLCAAFCLRKAVEGSPQLDHVYRIVRLVHSLQPKSISTRVRTSVFSHLRHFVIHGWKMCTSWAISNQRHFTVELYLLKSSIRRMEIQSSRDSNIQWYLLWYRNEVVNNFQVENEIQ